MELSKYQEKILRYFNDNPRSNMMISALAGSGKSTMACLLSEHTTTSDIYVAFNNSIAEEFRTKIKNPKTKVMTLHSLGLSIMNSNIRTAKDEKKITYANATLDNFKIYKIIDNELTILDRRMDFMKKMFYKDQYFTLYNLCRLTMTNLADSTALRQIIQDYRLFENDEGYQFPDITDCISMLKNVDGESWNIFNQTGVIDFTDMLYITYWKLERKEWEVPYYNFYTNIYADECLAGDTYIKTEDGYRAISNLFNKYEKGKKLPLVKSFNHEKMQYEYKNILNVKKHEARQTYLIKTEGLNRIVATDNHKFFTNRGYVEVKDLIVGKDVLILDTPQNQKTKYLLNDDQLQLVLASSIGDGHLTKQSKYTTYRISFTQGDAQYNYFLFKKKMLNCTNERKIKSGYTGRENINQAISRIFYLENEPWDMMHKIDERFLAIWFQDDGSTYYHDYKTTNQRDVSSISIACNNLKEEQCIYLQNIIREKFGVEFILQKPRPKYFQLRANLDSARKFLKIIAPYMNEDCAYKNIYFDKNNLYKWDNEFCPYGANVITSITPYKVEDVYDIEVEDNHNFFCSKCNQSNSTAILSHNCQDLSSIQINLLKFIKRKNGRYVWIGDSNQSIYNFCGANAYAMKQIHNLYSPLKEFDLPICYRCPSSHLKQVNRLFNIPILPRDDAPKGKIYHIEKEDILSKIHEGDMIISRKNKWLGSVIVDLAKAGKPIQIEDKEMVASIKKIVEKNKNSTAKGLRKDLKEEVTKYSQERAKKNSQLLEAVQENNVEEVVTAIDDNKKIDNYNFILGILKEYLKKNPNATKDNFAAYISNLLNTGDNKTSKSNVFTPKTKPIRICSVHKAKGLEAENVFVLNEGRVCFDFRNSKEQNQQEKNLSYISYTRAKNNLYLVSEKNTNSEEE